MSALTESLFDLLTGDATLTDLLATYGGEPAVFTTDPPPADAELPYLISAGEVSNASYDTKTTRGRTVRRDIRCYTEATGSAALVEEIAERVRMLLHRQTLTIDGFENWVTECTGPIQADEDNAHGRIVTAQLVLMEA